MLDAKLIDLYSDVLYTRSLAIKSLDKVIDNIKNIVEIIESTTHLIRFLNARIYRIETKLSIMLKLCDKVKVENISRNFLKVLIQNNRINYIRNIYEKLVEMRLSSQGITSGVLTTSKVVTISEIDKFKEIVEKKLDKKFALKHIIDPSIIGGIILQFGSNLYDASVAGASKNLIRKIDEA